MKILHIGIDSHFVDHLVARFEEQAPGCNELVVTTGSQVEQRVGEFKGPTSHVMINAGQVDGLRDRAAAADVVVVHAMSDFAALVCAQLPPGPVLVWSGFGYDYYVGPSAANMIGSSTAKLLSRVHRGKALDTNGRLVPAADIDRLEPVAVDFVRQAAGTRTDYFSAPVEGDLEVFKAAFPGFRGEYRQLNYGDLPSMARAGDAVVHGDDIMVGNSAAWSNNHLEAFRVLAQCDLGERRVVVPLTYGDPAYRVAVVEAGRRVLGERFVPLVDHMPLADYLDVVAQCSVMLFNHRRQQGVGNIVAALQQGSRVYLNRRNPLFDWLRAQGVQVTSVEDLRQGLPTEAVPSEELARHRAFLTATWSSDRVRENLDTFLAEVDAGVSASEPLARRPRGLRARRQR